MIDILETAEEIFKAKMACKEYAKYHNNPQAAKILFDDCLKVALMKTLKLTENEYKELYGLIEAIKSGDENAQNPAEPDYDEQYAKAMKSLYEKLRKDYGWKPSNEQINFLEEK